MAHLLLRKTLGGKLEPVDDMGREALSQIPMGDIVRADVKRPRNLGHHRRFFALVSVIYENQTRYTSPETLLDAIKVHIGHCDVMKLSDGREVHTPKSISFASMDQIAFGLFWDRVVACVCREIIPGLDRADLERELLDLVA